MKNFKTLATLNTIGIVLNFLIVLPVSAQVTSFDSDKPITTYSSQYSQTFNTWDGTLFYGQWNAMEPNIFSASDIAAGYLQFVWIQKRLVCSKTLYVSPYVIQTDMDYSAGSSRGGVVIRANPELPDQLQEPASGDPGFNREGIAFYPALDGSAMTVQFTGPLNGDATPVARIEVPKPAGVTNLRDRGTLRIEDFGASIYVYFNGAPYIRIDLGGGTGSIYTSGTVYNSDMQAAGTFTDMEVEVSGKAAIAQRDAALRLYSATINYNDLEQQTIHFDIIGKKQIADPPFSISASASSGLPVEFKLVAGPATLVGNTVTLTGEPGIVTISANQSGNSTYYPAPETLRSFYVSDPATGNADPQSQDYVDNWVVTDGLDRQLPSFDETGPKRDAKLVGVFYYTWHGFHGSNVHDITKIIANYPSDPLNAANPGWGGPGAFHFWGEPEYGYFRAGDPWVFRRDLQMLSNAHVDFIFIDVTNAFTYLETVKTLCEVSLQMRKEGIHTPQIAFTTHASSGQIMNNLYDEFYSPSFFDELWFNWNGKPLILGDFNDPALRADVKDFFTIKYCWAWTNTANEPNHWQWLDTYPQDYGWSTDPSVPEQIIVSVAQHPGSTTGTSYHKGAEPPVNAQYVTDFTGQGLHFAEQWTRALAVDPPVIMVTQWNEWTAQRFLWEGYGVYAGKPINNGDSYFVDAFTEEFNRDMAPMKGGHTDNYYYQFISNIRKYKGMAPPQEFSTPITVNIDGVFTEWNTVTPVFKDPPGDVMHRNFKGYDPAVTFINNTGRNDIIESRATCDGNNIYFFVKTKTDLTPSTGQNWMLLFLDTDRKKGTGWEGYDYVINYGVTSETQTTIKQWDGVSWGNAQPATYSVKANELEISVPRTTCNLQPATGIPEFYFHWADNPQHLNDITAFFTDGESAPDRRFNYNYGTSVVVTLPQSAFKLLEIPGTIEFEDFDNGGVGVSYADADMENRGHKYRPDESVDIEDKGDGNYYVGWTNSKEWLEYTVDIKAIGVFKATVFYTSDTDGKQASLYIDGSDKSGLITFPSTGGMLTWATKEIDMRLAAGRHILKFYVNEAAGGFNLDRIEFAEKDVVYPGSGVGLTRTFWSAAVGGRQWFKELMCTDIDSVINEKWDDVSPGCGIGKDWWNIRWEGTLEPLYAETYTFHLSVNDMGMLYINNELVIDAWTGTSSGKTHTGTISLTAGQKVSIKLEFAEKTGDASVMLEWESVRQPKEVVPVSQLYPLPQSGINTSETDGPVSVYPNPTQTAINIDAGYAVLNNVVIRDLSGRIIYQDNQPFEGTKCIKIDSWESGTYFVEMSGINYRSTQKIIKQ